MATVAAGEDRSVSIGRVFSRAFGTIASNPLATLGIAFLFSALPGLAVLYVAQELQGFWTENLELVGPATIIAMAVFSSLLYILFWIITQGALVRATVAFSEGRKASVGESVMAGLRVALPLVLLGVMSAIALIFGFLLLIVPGVILYVMWSVAAPALVEERLGPVEALGRSSDLTRGTRWKVFGLILILVVMYWLFAALVGLLTVMMNGGLAAMAANASRLSASDLAINAISSTIIATVGGVIHSSLFVELREWKDGPATEQLADIFG
ncbi:MAG TPA: hypothetical protein VFQ67_07020 [Allosphingosinicella sp.]|jgi:uncharacterized membrane protein|nr:hypothetical protein [Allosphingosinicella sp.]